MKKQTKLPSFSSLLPLIAVGIFGMFPHPAPTHDPSHPIPSTPAPAVAVRQQPEKSAVANVTPEPTPAPLPKRQAAAQNAPRQESIIASVTNEFVYHMFGSTNDPRAATDWPLTKTNAPAAWDITTGNNQVIVADIDSGFALAHEDLVNQWSQNAAETGMTQAGGRCWTGAPSDKSTNNCDDDNNGYKDDWRGWNFVKADNNPQTGRMNPTGRGVTHGTSTAGFIGASGNNGLGSTAINQRAKIMPLTVLDDDGIGYTSDITAAIYYAVDNGASVINLSLGTYSLDPALRTAINYATARSVIVVAAAGNCGDTSQPDCPATTGVAYPALFPDVIAVGAATQNDQRAGFSSYGAALDVSAPGNNLPVAPSWSQANQTSLYGTNLYGTSYASPQVASLVALIKAIRPSTTVGDITALIDATATKPSAMNGLTYTEQLGHGIVNAQAALSIALSLNGSATTIPTLLQTGSAIAEHEIFAASGASSGCIVAASSPCTIQFSAANGYKRFLPYLIANASGETGWSWQTDMLGSDYWDARARRGDAVSATPYGLLKKS